MTQDQASPSANVPDNDFAAAVEQLVQAAIILGYYSGCDSCGGISSDLSQQKAKLDAARSTLLAQHDALLADAERWRALMSSARMHFMGSSGFAMKDDSAPAPRPGEVWHFGMEFWSEHTVTGKDGLERRMIMNYVDALRARHALDQAPETRRC